jgi:hypothetical protein
VPHALKDYALQVEDDESDADRLADDAVVAIVPVPLTVAVVPDAVDERVKVAEPAPPETASRSSSISSIKISMAFSLGELVSRGLETRGG